MSIQSLPTPAVFDELTLAETKVVFRNALKLANYDKETKTIYRPLRFQELPRSFQCYKKTLERVYPKGEKKDFSQMNYEMLYTWLHDGCPSCLGPKEQIIWDLGDKHVEYFCKNCQEETTFTSHCHYEACATYEEILKTSSTLPRTADLI